MVYGFENHKPIFDFEHLILKLTYFAKTHPELDWELPETCPRPAWDLPGT
jgi:hypothetical protein